MRSTLRLAFAAIAVVWVVVAVASYARSREIAANVKLIADNSLTSIRLVERMGMDIERTRVLIDEHIFEARPAAMARIEQEIAQTRRDYEDAAREYDPLVTYPAESDARQRLKTDVAAVDAPVAEVLALSRKDDDAEARARMEALEPRFAAIERDVRDLVEINRDAAAQAEIAIGGLQRRGMTFHFALTFLAFVATLALGVWVTRIVARNERQLHDDAEALAAKNDELDAFAGRVAHDLRGPLSTVNMAAATLANQAPEAEATVAILRRGIGRMDSLIEDLLALSRVGAVLGEAVAEPRAVAASVEEELRHDVEEVGGALRIDVEPARVRCDEGLLREVLWNLGENAVKYRREDVPPKIDVTGRAKRDVYELKVADNGSGMSTEEARRAFEPFFRGARTRSAPGTGLGLSIVKRVVEVHGGNVRVESREGEGATFVVELPLVRDDR